MSFLQKCQLDFGATENPDRKKFLKSEGFYVRMSTASSIGSHIHALNAPGKALPKRLNSLCCDRKKNGAAFAGTNHPADLLIIRK